MPTRQLLLKGPVALLLELLNFSGMIRHELLVFGQREAALLDLQRVTPLREVPPNLLQLLMTDFIEADLVKEAQQPGLLKLGGTAVAVPHLQRTADKLIAARTFHAIDAEIGPTDTHRVFRRPGTRRVVFGGHKAVARINRGRNRRTQIDIAQPHHKIGGIEQNALYLVDAVQPVDAPNELQVAGAPGCVLANRL